MKNRFNSQIVKMPKSGVRVRDLSGSTITSMPFYQNTPVLLQEVLPGDDVNLKISNFCRLNTLQSPTFGRVTIRNRVFFVPLRTVWHRFDEFITQTPKDGNLSPIKQAPKIFESNLINVLTAGGNGYTTQGDSSAYSYATCPSSDLTNIQYRVFTRKGRFIIRILNNLGYNINLSTPHNNVSVQPSGSRIFSALPLLAYYRIWCDFFQYKMSENYKEYDPTLVDSSSLILTPALLTPILDTLCTKASLYDDDYFTLAGESPNIPIYGNTNASDSAINNLDVYTTSLDGGDTKIQGVNVTSNSTVTAEPALTDASGSLAGNGIGASALNFLQRAADYFHRKFNGGSTVVRQYMNEYGIELNAEEITHSKHLGSFETPINIADVTGTSGDDFGAQTSLGRGAGANSFHWKSDEFGYIIVTSVVVAHGLYTSGTPRHATRLFPLDFYHPDFDGLGMQAIRQDEIASGATAAVSSGYSPENVFGYIPRYSDYKVGHDTLSGNFTIRDTRNAYKGYYLARQYKPEDYSTVTPPHAGETFRNPNTNQNGWTPTSYDSIFLTSSSDNFLLFYQFDIKAKNSVRPLLDSYDWYADGDSQHMQGGANAFGDN